MSDIPEISSPLLDVPLQGYAAEVAVTAGEAVDLMLSGEADAQVSVVRLIHGDPNPAGPGYRDEPAAWSPNSHVNLHTQALDLGSYIEIPDRPALRPSAAMTVGLWIYPTRLTGQWQAIAAKWAKNDACFGLFCTGNRILVGGISFDGRSVEWCTGLHFVEPRTWQFVALSYDGTSGRLEVAQYSPASTTLLEQRSPGEGGEIVTACREIGPSRLHDSRAPLLIGALADRSGGHRAHFNGKVATPFLAASAIPPAELSKIMFEPVSAGWPDLIAAWDFSRDVSTQAVRDVSAHGFDGRVVNCPARAVTGPRWSGTHATLFTDEPGCYDAVYLHEDDLADPDWEPAVRLSVPANARSGIYAAVIRSDEDKLTIPFIVRPASPQARLCFIAPTLTWQAYSSNRGPYSFTEDGVIDRSLCIYDRHSDGSPVDYCTRRKPTRSGNPSRGIRAWGAHVLPADLYLVDWLEQLGFPYDVLCDQDLHFRGQPVLEPYTCIILGSHPEYWTLAMLEALESYLDCGGRVLYLGGNGLYWVTSLHAEQPFVMEVRKSGDGDFEPELTRDQPGEMQHSTSLEAGGLWSRRGRPARRLIGVEHSANVFVNAQGRWGFQRLPDSYDPRYGFVFEGVGGEVIGDFGLNLGTSAGYEMDSVLEWIWRDDWRPAVLARATSDRFMSAMRMPVARRSEMALTASPGGAAVFAAGSVTWTGSLSHGGYDNSVSRVTANVLRRFLETPRGEPVVSFTR